MRVCGARVRVRVRVRVCGACVRVVWARGRDTTGGACWRAGIKDITTRTNTISSPRHPPPTRRNAIGRASERSSAR